MLLLIYFFGVIYTLYQHTICLKGFHHLKRTKGIDILAKRPDLIRYLLMKPILWPYYFVIEKSPLERFSECFFKHYGEPGHTYYGTNGIRNFFNDLIYGKERYKDIQLHQLISKSEDSFFKQEENHEVLVTYAYFNTRYFLHKIGGDSTHLTRKRLSRFDLDRAQQLTETEFRQALQSLPHESINLILSTLALI